MATRPCKIDFASPVEGQGLARREVTFKLEPQTGFDITTAFLAQRYTLSIPDTNTLTLNLEINSDISFPETYWSIEFPDGTTSIFTVPDGTDTIDITPLIIAGQQPLDTTPETVYDYIIEKVNEVYADSGQVPLKYFTFTPVLGQNDYLIPQTPVNHNLSQLFVNGVKVAFLEGYNITDRTLHWLNSFYSLLPSDFVEFYYY